MKTRQTLLCMLWNPVSFIVYTLACSILFSASITMSDDPFVYGVLPDAAEAVNGAFADLPGSLWKLVTAFSLIVEEIVGDFHFHYGVFIIVIPVALAFSYREARSSRNGIDTERKAWMQWYDRQQIVKAERGTYEIPPLSKHVPGGTYFIPVRKTVLFMLRHLPLLIGHFVCWFTLFALPMLFDTTDFVRSLPKTVISAAIFTLILSYREARSHLKGMAIERGIWTKWYYRRIKTIAQEGSFEEPPSPENVKAYAYFGEIPETLFFMIRNLKPFIVHLTCWVSAYAFLCFMTLRPEDTPEDIFEVFEIIAMFGQFLPWIAIIVFVISYREARGNLKGIADRQQVWMQWYQEQQKTIKQGDTFEEPSPSENGQADSYFKKTQKTLQFMAHHPMSLIVHLGCWFLAFILGYGDFLDSMLLLFVIILALISSYQEARGTVKGTAKEGAEWMKWYQRQTGAKAQNYTLAEVPPALNAG